MKKCIAITAILLTASAAFAADEKPAAPHDNAGMTQGDMLKNCQEHMKDGKMLDSMPKDMAAQCQKMMNNGMMGNGMMGRDAKPAPDAGH